MAINIIDLIFIRKILGLKSVNHINLLNKSCAQIIDRERLIIDSLGINGYVFDTNCFISIIISNKFVIFNVY